MFCQSSKFDICVSAFISLSGLSIYLVISICHCLILSILNKTLLLGLPVTYIQCLPASNTFVLFNSQSDDDEIPSNFDASELFKYLSIKKEDHYFPLNSNRLSIKPIVYLDFGVCSKEIAIEFLMIRTYSKREKTLNKIRFH